MGQILKQMKETLKKIFNKRVLVVLVVIFLITISFKYIVFPGLTVTDSFSNVLAALIGIFSIVFVYHFIQWKDLFEYFSVKNKVVPLSETNYDTDQQLRDKFPANVEGSDEFYEAEGEEPFAKTRKKTKNK